MLLLSQNIPIYNFFFLVLPTVETGENFALNLFFLMQLHACHDVTSLGL